MDQRSGPSLSWLSSQCHKAEKLTDYLPDDLVPRSDMVVTSSQKVFSGVTGLLFFPANGENRKSFATIGESGPWEKVINPLWAVILLKVEDACGALLVHFFSPLHLFHEKLSGALLCLLTSSHRSGAHRPLLWRPLSELKPE